MGSLSVLLSFFHVNFSRNASVRDWEPVSKKDDIYVCLSGVNESGRSAVIYFSVDKKSDATLLNTGSKNSIFKFKNGFFILGRIISIINLLFSN